MELWSETYRDLRASFFPSDRISHGGHGVMRGSGGRGRSGGRMERWSCGARVTVTSVRAFLFLTESRTEATE